MENRINLNVDEENINIHIDETPAFTVEINPVEDFVIELNEQGPQGPRGFRGETGNGIESFELTSSSGLTDTYTITFTDGNTQNIEVENGRNAVISSVSATVNNTVGEPTVNVITDGTPYDRSFIFEFENLKGEQGIQGIQGPVGPQGPQGPEGGTRTGVKGDYCTTYGIEYCQYGLITNPVGTKNITVKGGMMLCVPGVDTKTTIGSDINYTIGASEDVTIFYAEGSILEVLENEVYYSTEEPIVTTTGYTAWWNPDYGTWKFISADTGNVWREANATPLADIKITDDNITRIDYIGYRVLNDDIYAIKEDVDSNIEELDNRIDNLGNEYANINLSNLTSTGEKHFLNKQQITNCLLEVPQNIKLELVDGTLTLKAGSKVIIPDGVNVFDQVEIAYDCNIQPTGGSGECMVCVSANGNKGTSSAIRNCVSGASVTPVNYGICYDTTTNIVQRWGNGVLTIEKGSLPLAIVTQTDGVITSIDQVFNGIGYIGSTIWVDKGVKGLIPSGRNIDGSLKNKEYTFPKVVVNTFVSENWNIITIGSGWITGREYVEYNKQQNLNYFNGLNEPYYECVVGYANRDSNGITFFQPKLPVRLLTYDDIKINNPYFFGQYIWSEFAPDNLSWLKSSGQWNSGTGYQSFYDWALANANANKAGFKLSTASYTDYDFVVNTSAKTFRLPIKVQNAPMGGTAPVVLNGVYGNNTVAYIRDAITGELSGVSHLDTDNAVGLSVGNGFSAGVFVNEPNSNQNYRKVVYDPNGTLQADLSQATNSNLSLYFYVGETTRDTGLINASQIASNFADKIGRAECKAYITQTYVNGTSGYRIWSDKYCEQWGELTSVTKNTNNTITLLKSYANTNYSVLIQATGGQRDATQFTNGQSVPTRNTNNFIMNVQDYTYGRMWRTFGYIA